MFDSLNFWKAWPSGKRSMLQFLAMVWLFAALFFIWSAARSPEPSIGWLSTITDEPTEVPVRQVQVGPFGLELKADSYTLWHHYSGTLHQYVVYPWVVHLILMTCCLILMLALYSTLKTFWFVVSTGLILFIVAGLRLDALETGLPYPLPSIFTTVLWIGTAAWLQYFKKSASLPFRLGIFLPVVLLTFIVFTSASEFPRPWIFLSAGFYPSSILLAIVFMILVAHEIQAGMLVLIAHAGQRRNGLRDFILLSLIYSLNLTALYLSRRGWFEWDYSVHPLALLMISGALAVWGVRRQDEQLSGFLPAKDDGVLMILLLGACTWATLGLAYSTGNDAIPDTLTKISLYIHLGYGTIFTVYMISNFGPLLQKNAKVYTVMYQPSVMPFFTYRFAGLITLLGFVFFNIWIRPVRDLIGGYYNNLADGYTMNDQAVLATGYYKLASKYAFHNHHSNYILAGLENEKGNTEKEKKFLQDAAERRPFEQTYLSLATLLATENRPMDTYAWLKQGLKDFPESQNIYTALGHTERRISGNGSGSGLLGQEGVDSVRWYFSKGDKVSSAINLTALTSALVVPESRYDSVLKVSQYEGLPATANLLTFASRNKKYLPAEFSLPVDSALNDVSSTFLNNYLINHRDSIGEEEILALAKVIGLKKNSSYAEALFFALAQSAYSRGMINEAVRMMERAIFISENKGRYNNFLAVWAMEHGAVRLAAEQSRFAVQQGFRDALLTQAVVFTEAGLVAEAVMTWDSVGKSENAVVRYLADFGKRVLLAEPELMNKLNDEERYAWCRYRKDLSDSSSFLKAWRKIKSPDLKALAILDRTEKLIQKDQIQQAVETFVQLSGIAVGDEKLYHRIRLTELRLLAMRGELKTVASEINKGFIFSREEESAKKYFTALLSSGDTAKMRKSFDWIVKNNSWFEDGVLAAAAFKRKQNDDRSSAYTILAEALHRNPYSIRILKAYIVESMRIGYDDFASSALLDLSTLLSAGEFKAFKDSIGAL